MATMSPELILASYSCARRDHMVRLTPARPLSVSSARRTIRAPASLRLPTHAALAGGSPRRFFWVGDAFFLPRARTWVSRPLCYGFLGNDPEKNTLPTGSGSHAGFFAHSQYI